MKHEKKLLVLFLICTLYSLSQKDTTKTLNKDTRTSYYIEPGSYGTKRESDPPAYVRNLGKIGQTSLEKLNWLELGFDFRSRFEIRQNDIRRDTLMTDLPILLRTRAYLGIKNLIDPFRFAVEYEDATRENGYFKEDDRDYNRSELIQAYGELYFKKLLGKDKLGNYRPVSIRFGRQHFEFLDRRLIGSNQWRNTTNNFIGFRASLGEDRNDFQLDLLALHPIKRIIHEFDYTDFDRDFGAVIFHWRKWSKVITIQPYYLALKQRASLATAFRERLIHSPGLRLTGWFLNGTFNYDVTATIQFGEDINLGVKQKQEAAMYTAEIGYKLKNTKWKPRFSFFYAYASGDKDPNDAVNNRFERFYGFARPWSSDDYIIPENIITPKLKVEFEPIKGLKIDGGYSFYWLASKTDRFNNLLNGNSNNRDKTGLSGKELGHGLDARVRFSPTKFIDLNIGYAHFKNGNFVIARQEEALGESRSTSNFLYLELNFNVIDLFGKKKK